MPLIIEWQTILEKAGHQTLVPNWEDGLTKAAATRLFFDTIALPTTKAVIVINQDNYIGPAAFSELAVGFCFEKRLFVAFDHPENFADELKAWNVTELRGQAQNLVKALG